MSENQNNQQQPPEGGQQQPADNGGQQQPPANPTNDANKQQPGPVPYDRFAEINEQNKALQAKLQTIEAKQKEADETRLKEENKFKELYEQRERELAAEKLARARLEVATKKGLPADLAARLQGDTTEAMEEDADKLLQFMKPSEGPGVPPAGKGGTPKPLDLSSMTPEEIRKLPPDKVQAALQGQ